MNTEQQWHFFTWYDSYHRGYNFFVKVQTHGSSTANTRGRPHLVGTAIDRRFSLHCEGRGKVAVEALLQERRRLWGIRVPCGKIAYGSEICAKRDEEQHRTGKRMELGGTSERERENTHENTYHVII